MKKKIKQNSLIKLSKKAIIIRTRLKNNPRDTPRVFQVETTWKWSLPRLFNVEYACSVCREVSRKKKATTEESKRLYTN